MSEQRKSVVREQTVAHDDLLGDAAEDESSDGVVLDLREAADGTHQPQLAAVVAGYGTTPWEVTPRVGAVLVPLLDDVLEEQRLHHADVERAVAVQGTVLQVADERPQLADGVGDVGVALRPPAADEPDEVLGLVPELVVRPRGVHVTPGQGGEHGEAEALVGPDQLSGGEYLDGVAVAVEQMVHVDCGTVLADVGLAEWQGSHVQ
jgi:hypothetical protein